MRVAGLLLAAGSSSRLGRPKQLIDIAGAPLVRRLAERALQSQCSQIAVVVGASAKSVKNALVGCDVTTLDNPDWKEGMASTIRVGIAWAIHGRFDAAILMVCDQPSLSTSHIDRLIVGYGDGHGVIASRYGESLGVPALFDHSLFPPLLRLRGKQGARGLIRATRHVLEIPFPEGAFDLDTEADIAQWRRRDQHERGLD